MIDVAIVDDHPIVRAGMRAVLDAAGDIRVLAEGSTAAEALQIMEQYYPQVLVLDVNLPDDTGLEVARRLRERGHKTAILALTVQNDLQTILGLLENGATGYVLKDEALETLVNAVRSAASGETWLSPAVATQVVQYMIRQGLTVGEAASQLPRAAKLTRREVEVLTLLADGLTNPAIADQLVLTTRTVQNHVSNIYSKLGVNNRTEAVLMAFRSGLVQSPKSDP